MPATDNTDYIAHVNCSFVRHNPNDAVDGDISVVRRGEVHTNNTRSSSDDSGTITNSGSSKPLEHMILHSHHVPSDYNPRRPLITRAGVHHVFFHETFGVQYREITETVALPSASDKDVGLLSTVTYKIGFKTVPEMDTKSLRPVTMSLLKHHVGETVKTHVDNTNTYLKRTRRDRARRASVSWKKSIFKLSKTEQTMGVDAEMGTFASVETKPKSLNAGVEGNLGVTFFGARVQILELSYTASFTEYKNNTNHSSPKSTEVVWTNQKKLKWGVSLVQTGEVKVALPSLIDIAAAAAKNLLQTNQFSRDPDPSEDEDTDGLECNVIQPVIDEITTVYEKEKTFLDFRKTFVVASIPITVNAGVKGDLQAKVGPKLCKDARDFTRGILYGVVAVRLGAYASVGLGSDIIAAAGVKVDVELISSSLQLGADWVLMDAQSKWMLTANVFLPTCIGTRSVLTGLGAKVSFYTKGLFWDKSWELKYPRLEPTVFASDYRRTCNLFFKQQISTNEFSSPPDVPKDVDKCCVKQCTPVIASALPAQEVQIDATSKCPVFQTSELEKFNVLVCPPGTAVNQKCGQAAGCVNTMMNDQFCGEQCTDCTKTSTPVCRQGRCIRLGPTGCEKYRIFVSTPNALSPFEAYISAAQECQFFGAGYAATELISNQPADVGRTTLKPFDLVRVTLRFPELDTAVWQHCTTACANPYKCPNFAGGCAGSTNNLQLGYVCKVNGRSVARGWCAGEVNGEMQALNAASQSHCQSLGGNWLVTACKNTNGPFCYIPGPVCKFTADNSVDYTVDYYVHPDDPPFDAENLVIDCTVNDGEGTDNGNQNRVISFGASTPNQLSLPCTSTQTEYCNQIKNQLKPRRTLDPRKAECTEYNEDAADVIVECNGKNVKMSTCATNTIGALKPSVCTTEEDTTSTNPIQTETCVLNCSSSEGCTDVSHAGGTIAPAPCPANSTDCDGAASSRPSLWVLLALLLNTLIY
eukprot:m.9674 g.9674  ORF g.9674 m.9674 type:complete len:981 (+) comp7871_c0_seq1:451-3393(+)